MKNIFKYLMLLLVATLSLSLTACGDDDEKETQTDFSVVGVWRLDFSVGYQMLTLESNGNYSLVEIDYESGNWSETGTFFVKDNIMTRILSDGDVEVYTILALAKNKMITRYEGSYLGQNDYYGDKDIEEWTRVE
ncbi:MAG: hypothetical protein ACI309_02370 [Candidatus Limisoma sp.]|nr:hypothetical protein [Bacteroidales bacterium]